MPKIWCCHTVPEREQPRPLQIQATFLGPILCQWLMNSKYHLKSHAVEFSSACSGCPISEQKQRTTKEHAGPTTAFSFNTHTPHSQSFSHSANIIRVTTSRRINCICYIHKHKIITNPHTSENTKHQILFLSVSTLPNCVCVFIHTQLHSTAEAPNHEEMCGSVSSTHS
jgi:hypothetical protein